MRKATRFGCVPGLATSLQHAGVSLCTHSGYPRTSRTDDAALCWALMHTLYGMCMTDVHDECTTSRLPLLPLRRRPDELRSLQLTSLISRSTQGESSARYCIKTWQTELDFCAPNSCRLPSLQLTAAAPRLPTAKLPIPRWPITREQQVRYHLGQSRVSGKCGIALANHAGAAS